MKMKLVLGDWSEDGHGKSREEVYEVNKTVYEVQEAYKASCKLAKVEFNHNENYIGDEVSWAEEGNRRVSTEYEYPYLSEYVYETLKEHGIQIERYAEKYEHDEYSRIYITDFEGLWWEFVKLSLPDLVYSSVEDDIPNINGYWDDNLNVQFGYGMF